MKSPAKPCFTRCDGRNQSKFYCQHFIATVKAKSANVGRFVGFSFQSGKFSKAKWKPHTSDL